MVGHLRLGAGRYIASIAAESKRRLGSRVAVLVSPDVDADWRTDPALVRELESAGVPVKTIGDFFHRDLDTLRAAAADLAREMGNDAAATLVHAHSAMPALVARWAGAGAVVMTCHGVMPARPREFDLQDAIAYQLCDALVSPSRRWAERLERHFNTRRVTVVPDGVDVTAYPPLSRGEDAAAVAPRLVAVCELTRRKGVDLLIRAMPEVWLTRRDITLHIVGWGDEGASLRRLAADIDTGGARIVFHGYQEQPYFMLRGFDAFVLPTRSDNFPAALVEAMLAGLPVIGTDVGGIPELIDAGSCGLVVPPESPDALAGAILRTLELSGDQRRRLGAAGEAYARRDLTIERVVSDLAVVYGEARSAARRNRVRPPYCS